MKNLKKESISEKVKLALSCGLQTSKKQTAAFKKGSNYRLFKDEGKTYEGGRSYEREVKMMLDIKSSQK